MSTTICHSCILLFGLFMVRYAARAVLAVNKPWMNFEVAAAIRVTTVGRGEAEKTHFHVLKWRFEPHNVIWAVKAVEVSLYELQWGSNTNHSGNLGFRRLWFSRSGSHTETEGEWQPDRDEGRGRRLDVRGEKKLNREERDENEEWQSDRWKPWQRTQPCLSAEIQITAEHQIQQQH